MPMGEGRGRGASPRDFSGETTCPVRSRPNSIPSRACPKAAPARMGARSFNPVPTFRVRSRLQSLSIESVRTGPLSDVSHCRAKTTSPDSPAFVSGPRPWTLDVGPWISEIPSPSRSSGPNQSRPNSIPSRSPQTIDRPNGAPLPVAERHLGAAQPRVPILRSCDVPAKPLAGRDQSMGRLARAVSPPVGTPTSRDEPSAAAVLMD
jgi:hypothetical protein